MGHKTNATYIEHRAMNKAEAWLNVLRISNTPTLLSNVLVGLGLAAYTHRLQWSDTTIAPQFTPPLTLLVITLALLCAYFGGLVLNDAIDIEHDKKHRPSRPLPLGIISKKQAEFVGSILLVTSIILASYTQERATLYMCLLVSCVLAYTYLHRWLVPAVLCMGACRGLTILVAYSAFDVELRVQPLVVFALGIAWYTAVLTYIARNEKTHNKVKRWYVLLLLPAAIIPAMMYYEQFQMIFIVFSIILFMLWVAGTFVIFQCSMKSVHGIHAILAGFCLLDIVYLSIIGEISIAMVAGICFMFTIAGQRKILGT